MMIVLDGMDCTGKTTICERLYREIDEAGFNVHKKTFPERTEFVNRYLEGASDISPARFQTACLAQKFRFQSSEDFITRIWVVDRWGPSGTVYGYLDRSLKDLYPFEEFTDSNLAILHPPEIGFILTANPDKVLDRLAERGDKAEVYERRDKIEQLYTLFSDYTRRDKAYILLDTSFFTLDEVYNTVRNATFKRLKGVPDVKKKKASETAAD